MEVRYLGFDQLRNARAYRFDVMEKGQSARKCIVIADMALFLAHRVGIQEGPTLSATKLAADLERKIDDNHELTADDLRSHVDARTMADAKRAQTRKGPRRRPTPSDGVSPWRNFGI